MLNADAPPLEARAAARLAGFPGFLRANGFGIGGGDSVQALHAADRSGLNRRASCIHRLGT